ncbi:MAG: hypothetical protein ACR2M1_14210 [Gemmatimonadaceae bacterium]
MLTSPRHANNDPDYSRMFYRRLLIALIVTVASLKAEQAGAQAVTGLGEDAALTPVGNLRLKIQSEWAYYDQRFSSAANGADAVLRPLGAAFTLDTLGARQLSILRPLQDSLRALSGNSGITVSLGRTTAQITDRVNRVPITLEAGISRWLSVTATVPIVHTSSTIFFAANPNGAGGNVGPNPALGDRAAFSADTAFAQQLLRAATAVQAYCASTGAGTSQCSGAPALVTGVNTFGRSLASLYAGSAFIPSRGSALQSAVDARAQGYRTSLNSFAGITGSGVPTVSASGVVGAPLPITTAQLQNVLTDPALAVQLEPLKTIVRTHLGDVEVAAKVSLFDSFRTRGSSKFTPQGLNARVSVAAGYRFPTGQTASPDNLIEIGTGTHQSAVLVRGYTDVLLGSHFWTSVVGRYTRQTSTDAIIRYAAPGEVFAPISARQTVQRQLGNITEIEALPRWVFNDFLSVGGQYLYRHKPADSYSVSGATVSSTSALTFDPLQFSSGSELTERRVGGGVAFSNAHAVQTGRSTFPFDVSYLHSETIRGANVPKLIIDQIQIRLYRRVRR